MTQREDKYNDSSPKHNTQYIRVYFIDNVLTSISNTSGKNCWYILRSSKDLLRMPSSALSPLDVYKTKSYLFIFLHHNTCFNIDVYV